MYTAYPSAETSTPLEPLLLRNPIIDPAQALQGDYHVSYATPEGRVAQALVTPAELDGKTLDMTGFLRGTRVMTEHGPRPVEELEVGDRVDTKDDGLQPLRWIARRWVGLAELARDPALRPVRLRAGALGDGVPNRDLTVAPGLRVLVSGWRCQVLFGEDEVLAPAGGLRNDHGVLPDHRMNGVEYVHLMCADHQILFAEGLEVESFHPGHIPATTLPHDTRKRLAACFPHLTGPEPRFGSVARPRLKPQEALVLQETAGAAA